MLPQTWTSRRPLHRNSTSSAPALGKWHGTRCQPACQSQLSHRAPTLPLNHAGCRCAPAFAVCDVEFDRKPAAEAPWTRELWVYDLRTNMHFTLKQTLRHEHLHDFIESYKPENRGDRIESERFKRFGDDELIQRDKVSLDLVWLRDDSLEDVDNLPPPDVIAQEIVESLRGSGAKSA